MYSYLIGIVQEKNYVNSSFVLEINNIGYEIFASTKTLSQLENGTNKTIYTIVSAKDDGIKLWGFLSRAEKEVFEILTSVSGVGPKSALSIVNSLNVDDIISAVIREKHDLISSAPGIGEKTAKRIILELKNKFSKINKNLNLSEDNSYKSSEDAISILSNLGFSSLEIDKKLSQARNSNIPDDPELLVKFCLSA